ncbi:HPr family phosphocarrier protein [Domibacillus sp. DTU_2020_1001157_1_SI_ALB_TIR_016]|uniref:HPr family phosphocarrier protein n=1 Tax=Domibacillus sp. DTU_2020_1001157_1_SI_ALB_TIR_016 TaxID=3077789 RepID=UPI0028E72E77|nr:HPr family phosphocarrier protein [Domibacillus sp. DTU_2020_1001157_1_SI_ALB_TIR_016]WNS79212.1 HPr family phosphocarrier protein [Domibacillus sp. DTU_2020_1001157_1_SI_ALB_TIR_016]
MVEINKTAQQFQSSIVIKTDHKSIDAKSILGLTYSILSSETFVLEIHGPDEEQAKKEMIQVFHRYNVHADINE